MATTTQLSPNSQAVVTMTGSTATTAFQVEPSDTAYWSPQVSTSFTTVTNSSDKGNNVVTFTKGLTVQLLPQESGSYTVIATGNIIDSGDTYPLVGLVIGTFTPSS